MKGLSKLGVGLALTAAATLATSGCAEWKSSKKSNTTMVKCSGINSCKGQTQCKTAHNACKGLNKCKGTGWLETSSEECSKSGGTAM